MPVTTVMMQQGLQIRDLIAQSGVAAKDLNSVLAFFKSLRDLPLKAISVFSKEIFNPSFILI
jgi:hypothetical protein